MKKKKLLLSMAVLVAAPFLGAASAAAGTYVAYSDEASKAAHQQWVTQHFTVNANGVLAVNLSAFLREGLCPSTSVWPNERGPRRGVYADCNAFAAWMIEHNRMPPAGTHVSLDSFMTRATFVLPPVPTGQAAEQTRRQATTHRHRHSSCADPCGHTPVRRQPPKPQPCPWCKGQGMGEIVAVELIEE